MEQQIVTLPDGTYAVLSRSMTWGDMVIILLLVAMLVLQFYDIWRRQ